MGFSSFPDVFSWIQNYLQIKYTNSINHSNDINSIDLCPSSNPSQPSLKLSINNASQHLSLSISACYDNLSISLWTSKNIPPKTALKNTTIVDHDERTYSTLVHNFIQDVLKYSSSHKKIQSSTLNLPHDLKDVFNFTFLSLVYVVCIYEAPNDLRAACLDSLKDHFACPKSREVSRVLMRLLGSNVEEQWMRSMNLAITNWIAEARNDGASLMPMFSYSFSSFGLWKVQLYCPVIAMGLEKSGGSTSPDERLMFSLNYHQLEGVIQLNYKVAVRENWVEVRVNTDNIRCDVIKLLTNTLMNERGAGTSEKHFPSRISLQMTPTSAMQPHVISVSVGKSSENHPVDIGHEKGIEASFNPPTSIGLHFSAGETTTTSMKPWKFEQSVYGNSASLSWFLHDNVNGREVFSSKPSKWSLLNPKSWFKNRYSSAHRPFTRQGGVIFAGDEYGESVSWKVERGGCVGGGVMEWEINGWIWLTYWPNKHRTFYTETRKLEFREVVHLNLGG